MFWDFKISPFRRVHIFIDLKSGFLFRVYKFSYLQIRFLKNKKTIFKKTANRRLSFTLIFNETITKQTSEKKFTELIVHV